MEQAQLEAITPQLEIIPLASLIEHERHDEQRTPPLVSRMQATGVLRNPPIATPLGDSSQRYMILDGANRLAALRKLDYSEAVVQVVYPEDQGLRLYNWNHVLWDYDEAQLLSRIEQLEEIYLLASNSLLPDLGASCDLAIIQGASGNLFSICTEATSLNRRVELLNAIVDVYKDRAKLDRTNEWSVVRLKAIFPNLCGLVIFPHFKIGQLLELTSRGCLLPTGITRFVISPRVLHLNYPLDYLAAKLPIEEKNEALQRFIQERIAAKGVRYYGEATFLFDE